MRPFGRIKLFACLVVSEAPILQNKVRTSADVFALLCRRHSHGVVCLFATAGALKDVYALANALYLDGQFLRAVNVLVRRNLLEVSVLELKVSSEQIIQ